MQRNVRFLPGAATIVFVVFFFEWGLKGRLYLNSVSSWLGVALCDGLGVLELSL